MARILIAPDKFKGSLTAAEVAAAIRRGMLSRDPSLAVRTLPVADGGDGTLEAVLAAGFERVPVTATGPTGTPVPTAYARSGRTAVIEMADVSGLSRLPGGQPQPLTATSFGTGEVLAAALDAGCRRIVLGTGGSACTDGGAGLVQALGARLTDQSGAGLATGGAALAHLAHLDLGGLHPALPDAQLIVACDVDNPLTGRRGAAAVYGPQKGASCGDVALLDAALTHWADHVAALTGCDRRAEQGVGAAGGVAFAAVALVGAQQRPGIELMLELLAFESHLHGVDCVIVGEGSLDDQTLHGKAPLGVARVARAKGARVVAVCGRRLITNESLAEAGIQSTYALTDIEPDLRASMTNAGQLLEVVGARIADDMLDQ